MNQSPTFSIIETLFFLVLIVGGAILLFRRKNRARARNPSGQNGSKEGISAEDSFISSIPDLARSHVEISGKQWSYSLDYSEESVTSLEKIIAEGWPDGGNSPLDTTIAMFGSYLGETIRKNMGGIWEHDAKMGYALKDVGGKATIFPFAKIAKRFKEGSDESLTFYYESIKQIIAKDA
jgi:hypothetical protein